MHTVHNLHERDLTQHIDGKGDKAEIADKKKVARHAALVPGAWLLIPVQSRSHVNKANTVKSPFCVSRQPKLLGCHGLRREVRAPLAQKNS
jgi:hypothetical protein